MAVRTRSRSVKSILSSFPHCNACPNTRVFQRGAAQVVVHPYSAPAHRTIIFSGLLLRYVLTETRSITGSTLAPPFPFTGIGSASLYRCMTDVLDSTTVAFFFFFDAFTLFTGGLQGVFDPLGTSSTWVSWWSRGGGSVSCGDVGN
jgi:hypothetical protein